jgi:Skp family chaperone for outer membrane proteins
MLRSTIALMAVVAMLFGTEQAHAAPQPPTAAQFATLDFAFLLRTCTAAKSARSQIEQMRSTFQVGLKDEQDKLKNLSQSLNRDRSTLSADALQERVANLQRLAAGYQHDMQERQAQINRALGAASIEIERKIVALAEIVKKEHGYTAVINRSAIVGTADLPDVTQEVLVQLNLQLPSVSVESPPPDQSSKTPSGTESLVPPKKN